MCGGVIFPYRPEYRALLEQYYPPEQIEEFERSGQVKSLYWQRGEPVLPVLAPGETEGEDRLEVMRWGNRDKEAPFPQTGWARLESIDGGKWSYLHPKPATIPLDFGVEKGRWFKIDHGIRGVVVEKGGDRRVYMLTDEADPDFLERTRHNRMPVLEDQPAIQWLSGDPYGIDSAYQRSLFE